MACTLCPLLVFTDFVHFKPHSNLSEYHYEDDELPIADKTESPSDIEMANINTYENNDQNQSKKVMDKFNDQWQISKFNFQRLEKFYTAPRMVFILNVVIYKQI